MAPFHFCSEHVPDGLLFAGPRPVAQDFVQPWIRAEVYPTFVALWWTPGRTRLFVGKPPSLAPRIRSRSSALGWLCTPVPAALDGAGMIDPRSPDASRWSDNRSASPPDREDRCRDLLQRLGESGRHAGKQDANGSNGRSRTPLIVSCSLSHPDLCLGPGCSGRDLFPWPCA